MGAIDVNRLQNFPADKVGKNEDVIRKMIRWGARRGVPFPGDFDSMSIDQMKAHVASVIGQRLKDEFDNDPDQRDYAGAADDAAVATLMNDRGVGDVRTIPVTQLLRRTGAPTGNIYTVEAENGAPLTLSQFLNAPGLGIRFYALTETEALRDGRINIPKNGFISDVQIELASQPPGMTDNDLFRLEVRQGRRTERRSSIALQGIPFADTVVTAADITAAKA